MICSCCSGRGIRKSLIQLKGQCGKKVVNFGGEGVKLEKTAKTMQHLTNLTRDFGLNSEYCGKPVKGFYIFEK